jgi:hypothetical protein
MAYVRGLKGYEPMDEREPGVVHLARQLTQQLGVPVREYFGYFNDQQRLSDYCRADAELCEQLVKLDYANEGRGLCAAASVMLGLSASDIRREPFIRACRDIAPAKKACAWYAVDGERDACRESLKGLMP